MGNKKYTSVYIGSKDKSLFNEQFDFWKYIEWNKDMPQYFKRLNKINDERSFVILSASLLEYQIDKFLKTFIPKYQILVNDNTNLNTKINIIDAFNLIPSQFIQMSNCIRNIRNKFAHSLEIDSFSELELSKPELVKELKRLWKKFELDMSCWKPEKSLVFMFKDICRVTIKGLHVYEYNVSLFRQETENPKFISNLKNMSTEIKLKNEKEHHKRLINGHYVK